MIYHGSCMANAKKIAKRAAILSDFIAEKEFLQEKSAEHKEISSELKSRGGIEKIARELSLKMYAPHETDRAFNISASRNVEFALRTAPKDGIAFGILVYPEEIDHLISTYDGRIILVPEKLDIYNLREIHLKPSAKIYIPILKKIFQHYKPTPVFIRHKTLREEV